MLLEVKNRSRRASGSDVEAFVTKAGDQNANKAVFVTAAGFQKGAIEVARRHGIDLFTVRFDEDNPEFSSGASFIVRHLRDLRPGEAPKIEIGELEPIYAIERATLKFEGGKSFALPTESSQMTYYARRTDTSDGRRLADLMQPTNSLNLALDDEAEVEIRVNPPVAIIPPDDYYFPAGGLSAITMTIALRLGRGLSGNVRVEPTSLRCPVVYRNVLTSDETRFSLAQLPLNTEPPRPEGFYFLPHPMRYYHCKEIIGDLVTWELIETFQNETLVRTTYTQKLKYAAYYVPVTDKATLERLVRRLRDYRALTARSSLI